MESLNNAQVPPGGGSFLITRDLTDVSGEVQALYKSPSASYHSSMPLFIGKNALKRAKEFPFIERDIQRIIEANLPTVFGLEHVTREFAPRGDLRIDTLAYDPEQKSFVIIEYKRGTNWTVVDQGFAYLALMLNYKAEFVLKYNECARKMISMRDINWDSSRVIFVAHSFNAYQQAALGFQDLPIELWETRWYEGNLLALNQLRGNRRNAKLSEVRAGSSTDVQKVQREVKTHTVEDHFKEGWNESRELYDELKSALLELEPRMEAKPVKFYIGFWVNGKLAMSLHIRQSKIMLHLDRMQPQDFNDPEKRVQYLRNSMRHYNMHVSTFAVETSDDIPYSVMLAKQVLKKYNS